MKNSDLIGKKCVFCLSIPKTLQTLKEHYKKSCVKWAHIEKRLGINEQKTRNMAVFMISFITITMDANLNVKYLENLLLRVFGTLYADFNALTNLFNSFNEPNELNGPNEIVYKIIFKKNKCSCEINKLIDI